MKGRRFLLWRWCPDPERMKVTRTRPADRSFVPLAASAVVLLVLAFQGIQPWAPSAAVNYVSPNSYSPFPLAQPGFEAPAQTTTASQITSAVSTEHLTVQLMFPESADPGQSVIISATTTAKSKGKVVTLTIEVYSYADKQLVKGASETVVKDKKVRTGDTWQTSLTAVIPTNAERAAMVGTVTEVWEETSYYYSSSYYRPYYYYYPYYPYDLPYPYDYSMYYYVWEPSYTVTQKSSGQTVCLLYTSDAADE